MATILKPDGPSVDIAPQNGTDFSLGELRHATDSSSIALSWGIDDDGVRRRLVSNDDSYELGLPVNEVATAMYMRARRPDAPHWDIRGDVLVCGEEEVC